MTTPPANIKKHDIKLFSFVVWCFFLHNLLKCIFPKKRCCINFKFSIIIYILTCLPAFVLFYLKQFFAELDPDQQGTAEINFVIQVSHTHMFQIS